MEHILYIMHIDWNWIKQRPQFIAEGLAKKYKVDVIYKHTYKKQGYQNNKKNRYKNLYINEVYSFPNRFGKYKLISKINDFLFKNKVKRIIRDKNIKYIYITSPLLLSVVPKNYNGKIFYDCMDDHYSLENNVKIKKQIIKEEARLIEKSDYVFISSEYLKDIIIKRYSVQNKRKLVLVRNGFKGPIMDINQIKRGERKSRFKITYFGTISSWFDFNLLSKSLNDFDNIEYELIGPIDSNKEVKIPNDSGIRLIGTVEHEKLNDLVQKSDALIMPFKVNEIIKAVDPVKLYEYINFDKNILSVYYGEIKRFTPFVYFYNDYTEYKNTLNKLLKINQIKYSTKERSNFLIQNTWSERIDKILKFIDQSNNKS